MQLTLEQVFPPNLIEFERAQLESEIINAIKRHPQWNANYNNLLHHDSMTMVIAIFTYLFGKNAQSFDRKLRENFINAARSNEARAYNLNEMNIDLKQNTESEVTLLGVFKNNVFSEEFEIPRDLVFNGTGIDGQPVPFEIIKKVNDEYDYFNNVSVIPGQNLTKFVVKAYSGITFRYEYEIDIKKERFTISPPYANVIEDSIQVYFYLNGSYFRLYEGRLDDSKGKIISEIFPSGAPKYALKYGSNGKPYIIFGTENFGGTFHDAHKNGKIVIYGRYGGGSNANITEGSINKTYSITLESGKTVDINFTNEERASGGSNAEDILEAALYAPLRRGRGRQIVDRQDAINELKNMVVKHDISTPQYYEEQSNNVPLLHNYHYLVPIKDLVSFVWPSISIDDNYETYAAKVTKALTDYFSIKGTHDSPVVDEPVSLFYNNGGQYNFYSILKSQNIFSNTLSARAYNKAGQEIDRIEFVGNYPLEGIVYNKYYNERATVKSRKFATIQIVVSSSPEDRANNNFKMYIDDHDYLFNIVLSAGTYTYSILAEALNLKIKQLITTHLNPTVLGYTHELYTIKDTHQFVEYDPEGFIQIISPKFGARSKIYIVGDTESTAKNLCEDLQITPGIYRPKRTHIVFKGEDSYFKYDKSEFFAAIETSEMTKNESFKPNVQQDYSDPKGPVVEIELYDKILDQKQQIQEGSNIIVEFWDTTINNRVDMVKFKGFTQLLAEIIGQVEDGTTGNVIKSPAECFFNIENSKLSLTMRDPIEHVPYKAGYEDAHGQLTNIYVYRRDPDGSGGLIEVNIQNFPAQISWRQNPNLSSGTDIYLYLNAENMFELGKNYIVKIATDNGSGEVIADTVFFDAIGDFKTEGYASTNEIQHTTNKAVYNRYLNSILIRCVDGVEDAGADPVYFAGFTFFDEIRVSYSRKNYEYITVNYKADPYHPEGEAKIYMDKLNKKSKRIISLEHIIKDINFIPLGIEFTIYVKKKFSTVAAKKAAYNAVLGNFQYLNYNPYHVINQIPSQDDIMRAVMPIASEYGITSIELNQARTQFFPSLLDQTRRAYFFFLTDDVLSFLKEIEAQYPSISGTSDALRIKINAITV